MEGFIVRFEKMLMERKEKRSDFCRNTQIKESTIRGWYKGQTPNVQTAIVIADYFGVSVKWLFTGEEKIIPEEERLLLNNYRQLNDSTKEFIQTILESLVCTEKFKK